MTRFVGRCLLMFVLLILSVSGYSETGEDSGSGDFTNFDKDNDSKIVKEEFTDGMKITTFKKLDKNGDGYVTWEEWTLANKSPEAGDHFKKVDKNKDEKIDFPEHSEAMDKHSNAEDVFKSADKDYSKHLSKSEFEERPGLTFLDVSF